MKSWRDGQNGDRVWWDFKTPQQVVSPARRTVPATCACDWCRCEWEALPAFYWTGGTGRSRVARGIVLHFGMDAGFARKQGNRLGFGRLRKKSVLSVFHAITKTKKCQYCVFLFRSFISQVSVIPMEFDLVVCTITLHAPLS